jgi:hypothetical protein
LFTTNFKAKIKTMCAFKILFVYTNSFAENIFVKNFTIANIKKKSQRKKMSHPPPTHAVFLFNSLHFVSDHKFLNSKINPKKKMKIHNLIIYY